MIVSAADIGITGFNGTGTGGSGVNISGGSGTFVFMNGGMAGSLSFTAARSAGLPFWLACLYPLMSSLTWEMFYEVDAPSFNDQITTTLVPTRTLS